MNVKYKLHGILFEWDSKKASTNLENHGISFETAGEAFHDPFVQVVDEEIVDDEERETAIGMTVDWRLLLCGLCYSWRGSSNYFGPISNQSREKKL